MLKANNSNASDSLTNLRRMGYFVAVVDCGSFTAAADKLGITKTVVSQQVARLEKDFQTSLLSRTTRKLVLTESGRQFYQRCVSILRDAEEAFAELNEINAEPQGTLKLTAPFDYGIDVVVPAIKVFTERYPKCKVNLILGDSTLDLLSDDIELAIRVGWLKDSTLQARLISKFDQLLVASPALERVSGNVRHPDDLIGLPFVANTNLSQPLKWSFTNTASQSASVLLDAVVSIDTTIAVKHAVVRGQGMSVLPDYVVKEELVNGTLQRVLPEWHLPSGNIYAVFPYTRHRPVKVKAFVDILCECADE